MISTVILEQHMKKRKSEGYLWARNAAFYNNGAYAIFSAFLTLWAGVMLYSQVTESKHVADKLWCNRIEAQSTDVDLLYYVNYLSKIWEIMDIWFVCLMGSEIALQFRFHHWTTIIVAWVSSKYNMSGRLPLIILNTFHHFFMYSYFAGAGFNKFKWYFSFCKYVLLVTGTVQLIVGVIYGSLTIYWRLAIEEPCNGSLEVELLCLGIYCVYFIFWGFELYLVFYQHKEQKSKQVAEKKEN